MPKTILIIDDSISDAFVLIKAVIELGYDVEHIKRPIEAIRRLSEIKPVLILLDVEMPEMDGYATLEKIRENSEFIKTPVIIQTGRNERFEQDYASMSGAQTFLSKPVDVAQLKSALARLAPLDKAVA